MDCPHIPELGNGEFSERWRQSVASPRVPVSGSLELSFRCNLRCAHCYVLHREREVPSQRELSRAEVSDILNQAVDEGCQRLVLTGGEPLLRSDFLGICSDAKKKGLLVTLFTNGTLITPSIADYLAAWRPFVVEITLYGRTQATYERITGVPGSHRRCLRGIELLLERGVPLKLKTMLLTLNRHELSQMRAYANRLGVDFRFDGMVNPTLAGSRSPLGFRVLPEDIVLSELADVNLRMRWAADYKRFYGVSRDSVFLYECGAGLSSFHVDPYGRLSLCPVARTPDYDLRSGSFAESWRAFLPELRLQPANDPYECRQCDMRLLCAQCPALARLENGKPEQRIEFLCRLAHLRAATYGTPGWT